MNQVVDLAARVSLLPTFVVAAALLVKGYSHTGDGFSAGVVAAVAVLVQYIVFGHRAAAARMRISPVGVRAGLVGLLLMIGVVMAGPAQGLPPLSHMPAPGEHVRSVLGIELHTALVFDLGIALLVFGTLTSALELIARVLERSR